MKCPNCGGSILGDGFTSTMACENAIIPPDREVDAGIILCNTLIEQEVNHRVYDGEFCTEDWCSRCHNKTCDGHCP